MKIAIYIRTSKVDQHPENQKIELERYAKAMDWEYKIFKEQESTRKTRPIKYNLFNILLKKEFDGVLVWKLDRWARSLQELISDIQQLKNHRVSFQTLKENIKIDEKDQTATSQLMLHILAAFAEFERAVISERTIAGLERARAKGKKLGRPKKKKVLKQGGFSYRLEK